jgi:hypothetical protein
MIIVPLPPGHANSFVIGTAVINNNLRCPWVLVASDLFHRTFYVDESKVRNGGRRRRKEEKEEEEEEEEEEDLFIFNDTIEGPRAPAVEPGRVTQA